MVGTVIENSLFKYRVSYRHLTPMIETFLPRDALLSAVYAVVVCLCVCVCMCLSHSGIVSKRLNVGSRKQRRTIAP